jgi:hypothetical protein
VNRISACGLSLLLAASLVPMPAQAVALGGGIAGSSCGAGIDLVGAAATTDFKPVPATANGSMLATASDTTARPEGTERRGPSGPVVQEAQWIRSADTPVAEPSILVLVVAGLLGMWAVARRRNLSS